MEITIRDLQAYLRNRYMGWAKEENLFLKLTEELGEVAEVINKRAGIKPTAEQDLQEQLGTELADMIHYILAIAAINDLDMTGLMLQKDRSASLKYHHTNNFEQFMQQKSSQA